MEFTRTSDWDLVAKVITHPRIWRRISDDFACSPEDWRPLDHPKVWYVTAREGDQLCGLFVVVERSPILCETHLSFYPHAWGEETRKGLREFLAWLWQTTGFHRAIADIGQDNPLALKLAADCGYREFGRNPEAIQRRGKLIDDIWVGITRPS